jgi:hypothetical protein
MSNPNNRLFTRAAQKNQFGFPASHDLTADIHFFRAATIMERLAGAGI